MLDKLITQNRSYRRFNQSIRIEETGLLSWINNARLSGSAANLQRLRYYYTVESDVCSEIFSLTSWAGYLQEWKGPEEGERPVAYIVILAPPIEDRMLGVDIGIASQSILLSAVYDGYGGCMIGAFNKEKISSLLNVSSNYSPQLVIALGKPVEKVILESITPHESVKYYRDSDNTHHVPKLKLEAITNKILLKQDY